MINSIFPNHNTSKENIIFITFYALDLCLASCFPMLQICKLSHYFISKITYLKWNICFFPIVFFLMTFIFLQLEWKFWKGFEEKEIFLKIWQQLRNILVHGFPLSFLWIFIFGQIDFMLIYLIPTISKNSQIKFQD